MLVCLVCQQQYKKLTKAHLRKHGLSTEEYLARFGLQSLGNTAWNKDRKLEGRQLEAVREMVQRREEKRKTGAYKKPGPRSLTEEQRAKIRERRALQVIEPGMGKRIWEIRLQNGTAFGPMKDKKHKAETLAKISDSSKRTADAKKLRADARRLEAARRLNLTLLGYDGRRMELRCDACESVFTRDRQTFDECRVRPDLCPTCFPREKTKSFDELEILALVRGLLPGEDVRSGAKDVIPRKSGKWRELDIYVPSKKLAIEYCGLYWHGERANLRDRDSHHQKYLDCRNLGIKLLTIFEDEWLHRREVVTSRISALLGVADSRVGARHCDVVELGSRECNRFLEDNHLQGRGRSTLRLGLVHQGTLVFVMTYFHGVDPSRNRIGWELNRMCSKLGTVVSGGASRLLKRFMDEHAGAEVISYADRRWSDGAIYRALGFEHVRDTEPSYWYTLGQKRYHRYAFPKHRIATPETAHLTEAEIMRSLGYDRIWDCGQGVYLLK